MQFWFIFVTDSFLFKLIHSSFLLGFQYFYSYFLSGFFFYSSLPAHSLPPVFFIFKLTCSFSPCFFLFKLTYSFSIQTNPPFLSAWLISLSILILSFISLVYLYSSIHCFSQLTDISIKVYLLFLSPVYFYLSLPTFSLSLVYYYIYLPTFSLPSVYFYLNCPIYSIQGSLLFLNLNLFLYQALIFILSYSSVQFYLSLPILLFVFVIFLFSLLLFKLTRSFSLSSISCSRSSLLFFTFSSSI